MSSIIQGEFGWSNSPLIQGMGEAEVIAGRGAAKVQNKFLDIFKRSPNMRAERAFSGLFQSIASGDIAGGIEALSSRMTGLGIIAGVAIGAGVAIFEKLREKIVATKEAQAALEQELTKHPVSNVLNLSTQGMERAIEIRQKLADDLRKKQGESSFASELRAAFTQTAGTLFGKDVTKGEKERTQAQADLNRADVENEQIILAQANASQKIVDIQRAEIEGDKRLAGHMQARLDKENAIAALREKGLTPNAFNIESGALQERQGIRDRQIDAAADAGERSLAIEEKIALLKRKGLTADDEKKIRATSELKDLDTQIANETSPQRARELKLKRQQKENEVRSFGNPNAPAGAENPFAFGTIAAREWENNQGGFGSIAARSKEAEDKGAFGSLANAAMLRGESPMKKTEAVTNADVVAAIKEGNDISRQAWLKP